MNKTEAIDKVEAANSEWCHEMETVFMSLFLPGEGELITTDDMWDVASYTLESYPREPRSMGAVMRNLQKWGYIKPLNKWQPSTRSCCHSRPLRVWRVL